MIISLEDRFVGTLVGNAVGDALGGPAEEIPGHPSNVQKPVTEMVGGGFFNLKKGQITDDTEMMLCLARSIANHQYLEPNDVAKRFMEWFYDSPIGAGGTTKAAMERLKEGLPWFAAGINPIGLKSTGNGSVMRCAPISLLNYNLPKTLVEDSYTQSFITHPFDDCTYSSLFVNQLIWGLLHENSPIQSYMGALDQIKRKASLHERYALIPKLEKLKKSGKVRDTTETAVHCLLAYQSFEESVVKAIDIGGDADTRAAITGAMAGACYGLDAIPKRWSSQLVDRHGKPILEEIIDLGKQLYKIGANLD